MFRDALEKGKIWADKIATAVLNYSELECKVRDATTDEPWGPHGRLMCDLARETYDYNGLSEIMNMLWTRIFPENQRNWRRIYKGLIVLAHLLRNGSEKVLDRARDHLYDLRSLDNYQCIDERGRDQGVGVRTKVKEVVELIQDSEFLQSEREKARSERKDYRGFGNTSCGYDFNSSNVNNFDSPEDDSYQFPRRDPISIEDMFSKPSSPIESRLGNFDSWKGGRERSVGDDVLEKFTSVMRVAKTVTDDFLGLPRVPPPSAYERNPHQVSEDVFTFPDAHLEEAENAEDEDRWHRDRFSDFQSNESRIHSSSNYTPQTKTQKASTAAHTHEMNESISPPPPPPSLIDFDLVVDAQQPQAQSHAKKLPRPPSVEQLPTSPTLRSISNEQLQPSVTTDQFAFFDNSRHQPINNNLLSNLETKVTPLVKPNLQVSSNQFGGLTSDQCSASPAAAPSAFDADFGDFATASFEMTTPTQSHLAATPNNISPTPGFTAFSSQPLLSSALQSSTSTTIMTQGNRHFPLIPPEAQLSVSSNGSKQIPAIIGKTWKEFDALNLDLDLRTKTGPVKPVALSLSQLQNQKNANAMAFASNNSSKPIDPSNPTQFADFGVFK